MRERPSIKIRRGYGETPYLRERQTLRSEPPLNQRMGDSHRYSASPEGNSDGSNRHPTPYWNRIKTLAIETISSFFRHSGSPAKSDLIDTTERVTGGTPPTLTEQPLMAPTSAVSSNNPVWVTEPSTMIESHQQVGGNFGVPAVQQVPNPETRFPAAMSTTTIPQTVYNFYYMGGTSPNHNIPGWPVPTENFPSIWNRGSILSRRSLSIPAGKRPRNEMGSLKGTQTPIGGNTIVPRHQQSASTTMPAPMSINTSAATFSASNISPAASPDTSTSNDLPVRKNIVTALGILQSSVSPKISGPASIIPRTVTSSNTQHTKPASIGVSAPPLGGGFFKSGPPAVIPDDDGFASNAGSDDENANKAPPSVSTAKGFSFGSSQALPTPTFGAGNGVKPMAPANTFSFGGGGSATSAPADKPAAPANPFTFGGGGSAASIPTDKPAAPANTFSFGGGGSAASIPTDKPMPSGSPFTTSGNNVKDSAATEKTTAPSKGFSFNAAAVTPVSFGNSAPPLGGGFIKSGPPAVIPDDDGFASNAGSDDENANKAPPSVSTAKGFSFGSSQALPTPTFGAGNGVKPMAPANTFSFGGGGSATSAPADKPAAPTNTFSFGGGGSATSAPADKPAAPANTFSFGGGGSATSAPADKPAAPANTFSFGGGGSAASIPTDKPMSSGSPFTTSGNNVKDSAATEKTTAPSKGFSFNAAAVTPVSFGNSAPPLGGGFFKSGPPAVIPDDDGFASNAGSDDENANKAPPSVSTAKGFSFGSSQALPTPTFGAGNGVKPMAPANTFSFGGGGSATSAPADKPAAPANPFTFGGGGSAASIPTDKPAAPTNPFTFGGGGSAASADKPAAPANPFTFGGGGNAASAPADKPAAPANPFTFGGGGSAASADKPAAPANPFTFGGGGNAAPADKPAAPANPFTFGGGGNAAPADKPAAPANPFTFGGGGNAAPADKPAAPANPFTFGGGESGSIFTKSVFSAGVGR